MRRVLAATASAAALLVLHPASLVTPAAAQVPTVTPTPTPTVTPAPVPAPVAAKIRIKPLDTHRDGDRRVVVSGRSWRVSGTVTPYVAGETVTVRLYRNGRRIHAKRERLLPTADGRAGTFRTLIRRGQPAGYAVKVTHEPTAGMARARSNTLRVLVVGGSIGSGQRGAAVRLLQRGLARLHYAVPRSGVYDDGTARAVMAWRKVSGRARTYTASRDVLLGVLAGRGGWKVRHPRDGRHVEADLSQQVLVLVDGDEVHRIYHTSSGAPATPTILGRFHVYRKDPGTNAKGMVHSSYFQGGYAIHGYVSVPPYNASHGCLRVPIPDSWSIYQWVRMGSVVWVER
jgi:hypothetical protein